MEHCATVQHTFEVATVQCSVSAALMWRGGGIHALLLLVLVMMRHHGTCRYCQARHASLTPLPCALL